MFIYVTDFRCTALKMLKFNAVNNLTNFLKTYCNRNIYFSEEELLQEQTGKRTALNCPFFC